MFFLQGHRGQAHEGVTQAMNGYLSGHAIARELRKRADEFESCGSAETFNVSNMTEQLTKTAETLRLAAIADIDTVAVEVVGADALASNPLDIGTWHKIHNIKAVRERTGTDLREAKLAVERAYATVARNLAVMALAQLETQNARYGYGLRQYVNAVEHKAVLADLWDAANGDPGHAPF